MALSGVSVAWYTESTAWSDFKKNIVYDAATRKATIRVPYKVRGKGSSYTGGHIYISVIDEEGKAHANLILNKSIKTSDIDKEIQSVEVLDVDPANIYKVKLYAAYTNHVGDHSSGQSSEIEFAFSVNQGIIIGGSPEPTPAPTPSPQPTPDPLPEPDPSPAEQSFIEKYGALLAFVAAIIVMVLIAWGLTKRK